jgi:hypothetical protein
VEREAIAREGRREQAVEALTFERERELALQAQLTQVVLEHDGARVDALAFAHMTPGDVELVRDALGEVADEPFDEELDVDLLPGGAEAPDDEDGPEAELARLEAEIEQCRARQRAIESYVTALDRDAAPS